jgi:hypothetical protein
MPDQPKPHAYMISLVFGNGPISQTALVALDLPNAVALCAFIAGRDPNITGDLTGCAALELTPEWLRRSLRMLEDGKSTGDVVSLVSDNAPSLRDGMRISDPGGPLDGKITRLADPPAPTTYTKMLNPATWPTPEQAGALADRLAMDAIKTPPYQYRAMTGAEATRVLEGVAEIEGDRCPSHTWEPLRAGVCPLCQPTLGGAA